jgi:Tfp pilus assembly protein PilN
MKVRLNLATSPLENNRRFVVFSSIIGSVGLLAMALLSWNVYSVRRSNTAIRLEQARIESDMQALRRSRADLEAFFNRPETIQRRDLSAFLNGLIAQRAFPWTKIFMDLERNLPDGVRVVSIMPRLAEDHLELKLTIGAKTDEGKLRFLKALEDSRAFSDIEVLGENRTGGRPGDDQVLMELNARYSVT